ncbi:ribose import ATP-binding protein RbsA [Aliidongia dinghuensis]|uniref:Ribose import ATP-binding protein RbsA n=1 Tax=Aliidongia dinghuensis TaxID=1867774 RepID=A0A8J2YQJ8_9PROT|nr:sugar ABC transporter ATP-binding protein [Aliidongia dinghuensis]GGF05200.1 ribose import ATP-binding protein RbsA [Aliidongia dinghuensis]
MPFPSEFQTAPSQPILEMVGISKTFPGVKALRGVELRVYPGEIHALMGENGAGKSTLMKVLAGAYRADPGGEIRIAGDIVHIGDPLAAKRHGIAIIYQELALAPNLTVAENIYLGCELGRTGLIDRKAMAEGARAVLDRLGAGFGPTSIVADLSIAERQLVEIARALHAESKILVMDEPTTALSSRETDALFVLIRRLRAEGLAIVYISHRMAEVYELADRVTVLRDGGYVGSLDRGAIEPDAIVRMMVGRDLSSFYKKEHRSGVHNDPILTVKDMGDGVRVHGCSFTLHAGEVLGLAGLVGAGRTELARLVYGADERTSGTIELAGRPVDIRAPEQAIEAGLVYLTEDRKGLGLFLDMPVAANINLGVIGRDAKFGGLIDRERGRRRAAGAITAFGIRVASPAVEVGSLSGGNQQKVMLSRLLETKPKVLILDEPTRGVDIGAKSEIYRIIDNLAKSGVGVLVISSELPEIVGIADRVMVMREGRLVGEVGGDSGRAITQENIIALATGADQARIAEGGTA